MRYDKLFARKRTDENYDILFEKDGESVTQLDYNEYPVGSELSVRYEHPEGIVFTAEQVAKNNIEIE